MPTQSHAIRRPLPGLLVAVALALAACAPTNTNTTYSGAETGRTAQISYGTLVSMRGITLQNPSTGAGTLGGTAVSGVGVRGNILGAVGGAIVGGLAGTAVESSVSTEQAVEFIIQEDNAAAPISVVQSNELNFRLGERILLTRGARTRIARVGA